jgi:hypothetical protein
MVKDFMLTEPVSQFGYGKLLMTEEPISPFRVSLRERKIVYDNVF